MLNSDKGRALLFGACLVSTVVYFGLSHGIRGYLAFVKKILVLLSGA